ERRSGQDARQPAGVLHRSDLDRAARQRRVGGARQLSACDRSVDRQRRADAGEILGPRAPARLCAGRSTGMKVARRQFVKGGVAAFTVTFAAPEFLSDLARAQGSSRRNLVVLNLSGGNDSLSMLIPYNDANYYSRRPTIAVPAGQVLQIGSDSS